MMKKQGMKWLILGVLLFLSGCGSRIRIPQEATFVQEIRTEEGKETSDDPDAEHRNEETAEHKEYANNADAEMSEEASSAIVDEQKQAASEGTETNETGTDKEENSAFAVVTGGEADLTITETESSETADQYGIGTDVPETDSAILFYHTLLQKLDSDLFECKKLYVYMETQTDYQTVHKSSAEHEVIMRSAAYDTAAKLTEETLFVNDGWVIRKNPEALIKIVPKEMLGVGISDSTAAEGILAKMAQREGWKDIAAVKTGMCLTLSETLFQTDYGRLAAAVYMAKLMHPEQMENIDPDAAWEQISKEATGKFEKGIYAYQK